MRRLNPTLLVALVPLLLVAAAFGTGAMGRRPAIKAGPPTAQVASQPASIEGSVIWGPLALLPPDARVTVRLLDVTRADGAEDVLGGHVVDLAGNPYPALFSIGYDPTSILPGGQYVVVASITSGDVLIYQSLRRTPVLTGESPTAVDLVVSKVGPWSSFDIAVDAGRLARISH